MSPHQFDTGTHSTLTDVAVKQPARADVVIRAAGLNYAYGTGTRGRRFSSTTTWRSAGARS